MNKKDLALVSGVIILILISYSNTFKGVFFYDDKILMPGGFIKSVNFKEVFGVLCSWVMPDGVTKGVFYRPLLILSYFIDYKLWQNNVVGYHLTNIILHIINCVVLFLVIKTVSNSTAISFMTTALFSLHPIQVEAVTWISGRNELLLTLFMLLALLLYTKNKISWSYGVFLLALFTKETALFLLSVFIIYDLCFSVDIRRAAYNYIGFLIITALYLYVRSRFICGMETGVIGSFGVLMRKIIETPIYYLNYLRLFFYPAGYAFEPAFFSGSNLKFLYIILTAAGFLCLFLALQKSRIAVFGLLWFLLALFPCAGILPMPWPLMEHRLYFPSIGIFLCLAYGFSYLIKSRRNIIRISALSLFALLVIYFSAVTYERNNLFASEHAIWQSTIQNNPGSSAAKKFL